MTHSANHTAAVSCPSEELVLVDAQDAVVGYGSKGEIHRDGGQRHRAFSIFLFDDEQRLLIHRRSQYKPLWPGYWTNSCCSHPRRGEALEASVKRRLREELGCAATAWDHVFAFEYHAEFRDAGGILRGSEHELCHVYLARLDPRTPVRAHEMEVEALEWLPCDEIDRRMRSSAPALTPWFKQEWKALRGVHRARLDAFLAPQGAAEVSA